MFGCGKFDDITLLKYLDKSLEMPFINKIDSHLTNCTECLKEITELNRINAEMERVDIVPIKRFFSLSVLLSKGVIASFSCKGGTACLTEPAATRSVSDNIDENTNMKILEFYIDTPKSLIMIIPDMKDKFDISIEHKGLKDNYVELKQIESEISIFLKKAKNDAITIKGVKPGRYELNIGDIPCILDLREDTA